MKGYRIAKLSLLSVNLRRCGGLRYGELRRRGMRRVRGGFTLVELLVVIAVIAILVVVGTAASRKVVMMAKRAEEVSAAKSLVAGVNLYAQDHNGRLLPGYGGGDVVGPDGQRLDGPSADRYPWRIFPYVGKDLSVLVFGENEGLATGVADTYAVSTSPNLGMNANFVGGHRGSGALLPWTGRYRQAFGNFVVDRLGAAPDAGNLVVFASAHHGSGVERRVGYFEVRPPRVSSQVWADEVNALEPASSGQVDFRWGGKAVCGMLAGNVELLDAQQLRDMRLWSRLAQEADEADHVIGRR